MLPQRSLEELVSTWPDLTFWYHIPPTELARLPRGIVEKYLEELPKLKHEQTRMMIMAAGWPYISDDDVRKDLWDMLNDKPVKTWQERAMEPGMILAQEHFFPTLESQGFQIERIHVEGGMKWPPDPPEEANG